MGKRGSAASHGLPDVRLKIRPAVALRGTEFLSVLSIGVENHSAAPIFIDRVFLDLDRREQFVWMNDYLTGEVLRRTVLQPGDSKDYNFDPRVLLSKGISFERVRSVSARDAIGRDFHSTEADLPGLLGDIAGALETARA
jgi:hypothetical protein